MPGDGLALRQDRHRSVVAMETLGGQHMRFDEGVERSQRGRADPDLVRQRRHAQLDAFTRITFALPVQRLMLTEFLEQDHGQEIRPGEAARRHMEWRRRLG